MKNDTRNGAQGTTPSIIAEGVEIVGDIRSEGEIHLDGKVKGNIDCTGLTMGEKSMVEGSIKANSAIIRGKIDGLLAASDVRFEKTARLEGEVYHKTLGIEAGANITGRFIHGDQSTFPAVEETPSAPASKKAKVEARPVSDTPDIKAAE